MKTLNNLLTLGLVGFCVYDIITGQWWWLAVNLAIIAFSVYVEYVRPALRASAAASYLSLPLTPDWLTKGYEPIETPSECGGDDCACRCGPGSGP